MKTANDRQVAGTHYSATYQHWDMAMDYGLCHLAAAATKYLARYQKKNGVEDVRKAEHYLEKWLERVKTYGHARARIRQGAPEILDFIDANGVTNKYAEYAIINVVAANSRLEHHVSVVRAISKALEDTRALIKDITPQE